MSMLKFPAIVIGLLAGAALTLLCPAGAQGQEMRTVISTDGRVRISVPATYADRPAVDVTVLSVYDFHTHRSVVCTAHHLKLNDPVRTLADFAHKTTENSDLSGPKLSAPQRVKLESGIYAMQSERRVVDPRETRFEIVTMVAVPDGYEALSVSFPEVDGKVDRAEMDRIIASMRLPKGGGQESSVPTTGPATAPASLKWVTKNRLVSIVIPESFELGTNLLNPEALVVINQASRMVVNIIPVPRNTATLGPMTDATRADLIRSNFAAKATRPQEIRIGEHRAQRFECTANVRGEDMLSVATILETPRSITILIIVGPLETIRSQRDFIDGVAASLQDVPPGTVPPATGPTSMPAP